MPDKSKLDRRLGLLLILPIVFSFAVKPALLFVSSWQEWLLFDYLQRTVFLAYVLLIPSVRAEAIRMFGRSWPDSVGSVRVLTFLAVILAALMIEVLIEQVRRYVYFQIPGTGLFNYFEIESRLWLIVDLTLGLILVAICEELEFRGFLMRFLGAFTSRAVILIVVSAIIFGLAHWTNGVQNVLATGLTGLMLCSIYLWSKSLWPGVVIHYLINLGHFWPN